MRERFIDWLGWYGVAAVVVAYALTSALILPPNNFWYQFLNFTGSVGVTVETWYRRDYQPFWLNLIWAAIALFALANIIIGLR